MRDERIVVIGAGIGGLAAALDLARSGACVTVVERASGPGGKLREVAVGGRRLDAGPTVLTLRRVFDDLFAAAGASLADHLTLRPAATLARHAWSATERLDLYADAERSAAAIGAFAGAAEARRYREFCRRARRVYATLDAPFMRANAPSLRGLVRSAGVSGLAALWQLKPFRSLWQALGEHFHDPRLRQLFGRYATYCGSSPFRSPATLMLVAHVEQEGVWLVDGGMHRIAVALAALAQSRGATFRYATEATAVVVEGGRATGVCLAGGEFLAADAVVVNADVAAVAGGRFGLAARRAVSPVPPAKRSLSAVTWALVARAEGFPLLRHTVFFSADYAAEFDDLFRRARMPSAPTVYVCAQDRDDRDGPHDGGPERLLCLVNAPATGDARSFASPEIEQCASQAFELLQRCGLRLTRRPQDTVVTTPAEFEQAYPATGGALYGRASHGWTASFRRPGAASRIPGLYLAGGSTHPGPGLPMAALSGRMAAATLLADRASMPRSRPVAMLGGMSTR